MKSQAAFAIGRNIQNPPSANRVLSTSAFVNLNLIRALSGLAVVFSHYFQIFILPIAGRTKSINIAIALAEYAVLAFFTLSGFLIALSIERNIQKNGHFEWREYLVARVARIYPALIASVLLCIFLFATLHMLDIRGVNSLTRPTDVYPPARTEFSLNLFEVIYTLMQTYAFGPGSYISANGPLWTLSYEVGFYLVAGLLITLMRGKGLSRIVSAICLMLIAIVSVRMEKYLFLHYGTIWMLGVCLFLGLKAYMLSENTSLRKPQAPCVAGESAICSYQSMRKILPFRGVAMLFTFLCATNAVLVFAGLEGAFIHDFSTSILIITVLFGITRFRQNIFHRFAKMADSTYTLYLFHFPLMIFFYALIRDTHDNLPVLYFVVTSISAIGIVHICHFVAKLLEDRRRWETLLSKPIV